MRWTPTARPARLTGFAIMDRAVIDCQDGRVRIRRDPRRPSMPRSATKRATANWARTVALLLAAIAGMLAVTIVPAAAAPPGDVIVLPGASSAEGIAKGAGATFYAGDLFGGDIFRGDLRRGTAELFIDAPDDPDDPDDPDARMAVGMFADVRHGLLFVAGGPGAAYVYDTGTGATVASYQLGDPASTFVNDVTVTRQGAWFTDSLQARLYFVPVSPTGVPGPASTLPLSGPAAEVSGPFNLNGITATPNGKTLIVGHSGNGALYTVDPATGASSTIAGVSVPNVDGILLEAGRLWAVRGADNVVARVRLSPDLTSGVVERLITHDAFQFPSTAIRFGNRLAVVNAKFDTGVPPAAEQYEVVLVDR
jgi:sugar lactone lactonase YvrE